MSLAYVGESIKLIIGLELSCLWCAYLLTTLCAIPFSQLLHNNSFAGMNLYVVFSYFDSEFPLDAQWWIVDGKETARRQIVFKKLLDGKRLRVHDAASSKCTWPKLSGTKQQGVSLPICHSKNMQLLGATYLRLPWFKWNT